MLGETLASLQTQTYPHWEAVVVDDGSTDGTAEAVEARFGDDARIRYHTRQGDKAGAPVCRNQGTHLAQGEFVIYLDSDDLLAPECLRSRVSFLQKHPELDFCVAPCWLFYEEPGDTNRIFNRIASHEDDLDRFLAFDWPWQTSGPLWRLSSLQRENIEWDEELIVGQDMDFSCHALVADLRYQWIEKPDFYYRMTDPAANKIGIHPLEPRKLPSQLHRIERLCDLLSDSNGMIDQRSNPHRIARLAGNFFLIARKWAEIKQWKKAVEVWKLARKRRLLTTRHYYEGVVYFSLICSRGARIGLSYLKRRWPVPMFVEIPNKIGCTLEEIHIAK
ncbi:MAG: hypothetical protein OHK0029_21740 [Armatimonadaceae bacterium]